MQKAILVCLALTFMASQAHANLCRFATDLKPHDNATRKELKLYKALFPNTAHHGSNYYNGLILSCNRVRDGVSLVQERDGNTIRKMLTDDEFTDVKKLLKKRDLPPFFHDSVFQFFGLGTYQIKYVLWKEAGVWQMVIPYKPVIKDYVKNRIDFRWSHAENLFEKSQVDEKGTGSAKVYKTIENAKPITETICKKTTYFSGKSKKKGCKYVKNAPMRNSKNTHISLGKLRCQGEDDKYLSLKGCRVKRNVHLYGVNPLNGNFEKILPEHWILNNFEAAAERHWNQTDKFDKFRLHILLKGHNEKRLSAKVRRIVRSKIKKDSDYLPIWFATRYLPHGFNQMYKSNVLQPDNFSTMTKNGVHVHEVGHAFGLDDEYAGKKDKKKHCQHKQFDKYDGSGHTIDNYTMCNGYGTQFNTIYHYIAVSRYVLRETCTKDKQCGKGRYCNNRLGKVNRCLADRTKTVGQSCVKNRECKSNDCEGGTCVCKSDNDCPANQMCNRVLGKKNYCSSISKGLGKSCTKNKQCRSNKCEGGTCVCKADSDCPSGKQCFRVMGKKNYCSSSKKKLGQSCKKSKECKSNDCEGGVCVCKVDSDCPSGKRCKRVVGKKNYCTKKTSGSKALGKSCKKDKECRSNKCEGKVCVCKADSDCANGKSCFRIAGKKNYCASKSKKLGASCKKSSECKSNDCEGGTCVCKVDSDCPSGKQCFRVMGKKNYCASTSKALGKKCSKNKECKSNKCEGGTCVCKKHSDCPGKKKCKRVMGKKNYCK